MVPYRYLVTNTGQTPLQHVAVTDDKATVSCPSSTLAGGTSETCTASYAVTQAEVDSGNPLSNTATASASSYQGLPLSSAGSTVTLPNVATSSVTLVKSSVPTSFGAADQTIHYNYLVTNTGTTTLSSVAVTDSAINPFTVSQGDPATPVVVSCPSPSLAPGTHETCGSDPDYVVTQSDVDSGQACSPCNGSVTNTAQASAQNPGGATIDSAMESVTLLSTDATASADFTFSCPTCSYTASSQTLTYHYDVTNTGTISLFMNFNDSLGLSPTCPDGGNGLAPGASETCTADYMTTAADVTAGHVADTASLAASDFDFGNPVTSPDVLVTVDKT
jgi:uncharacterized repeat protein (TIGR01451 family)